MGNNKHDGHKKVVKNHPHKASKRHKKSKKSNDSNNILPRLTITKSHEPSSKDSDFAHLDDDSVWSLPSIAPTTRSDGTLPLSKGLKEIKLKNRIKQKLKDFKDKAVKVISSASKSLTGYPRKEGKKKTSDEYRQSIFAVSSPSQLSIRSITERYVTPSNNFKTPEDVFKFRGYTKMDKIDEGAFGIVSKALKKSDKSTVAVKEVDLRRKRHKRLQEMKRELFVLQRIAHKNIVKLIEHFIVNDTLVIVMEFCAGSNLTVYLRKTALDELEAINLFRQMARAIKVLHRNGISHRDIKLNNFLLDSTKKRIKIGDFGLSIVSYRAKAGILMAKTYCGTEPYMAPEILKRTSIGTRSYNAMIADIWSLGICLYAMLTRTFPFRVNASQQSILKAQINRRWKFPRAIRTLISEELKDLVWHMLDPDPYRRITINGVVAHPWINPNQVKLSYGDLRKTRVSSKPVRVGK